MALVVRKNGNGRKKKTKAEPSVTALVYNGPTRVPLNGRIPAQESEVTMLVNTGTVISSAGGVISDVYDSWSQVIAANGWTQNEQLFAEGRVLSMDLEWIPWNPNNQNLAAVTVNAPIWSVEDRANATALAATTDATGFATTVQLHPNGKKFRRTMRMQGTGESDFHSVASPPTAENRMYVKLYSNGNSATTTYYTFVNRIMVQFRNRK